MNRKRITFINNNRVSLDFPRLKEDAHISFSNLFLFRLTSLEEAAVRIKERYWLYR